MALTNFTPARELALPEPVRIGLEGLPALLLVYGLVAADLKRLWRCPPRLAAAGDWSYALYLIHTVVIAGVCMLWRPLSRPGLVDNAVAYGVSLGLSVALSGLFWIRLERPMTRWVSRILRACAPLHPTSAPSPSGWTAMFGRGARSDGPA
jgi:peptidoglycan/LPS O-acetylase OafA/YrhL